MPFLRLNVLNAHDITWANRATAPSKINSSRVITRAGLWHRNVPHRRFSPCIIYWPLLMFALWRSFRTMLPSSMVAHFFYSCYGMERHSRNGKLLRKFDVSWSMRSTRKSVSYFRGKQNCEQLLLERGDKADDLSHTNSTSMGSH